ncbi:peptidase inhibitor family I36 protein [Kribbella albertanoniae]|uniref:Uncharacterized protein n=1 Tax=Kribbella albertanoniae TaxID=1266829 RepID=A0A4R4QK43_9ACTN|nr:peptidase inhibitor family I36 protein [Kribbella albertanoniae]TDC35769.1 hypothetical protein E1261_00120 [Kribbella albertanoniae]
MHHKLTRRVRAAVLATVLATGILSAAVPATAQPLTDHSPAAATGQPQVWAGYDTGQSVDVATASSVAQEMAELLKLQPTGIQVSDNAIYVPENGTTVVWPSPGQTTAPDGLGTNIRPDALKRAGITSVESQFGAQTVEGCPSGITAKDYYCFYTAEKFAGRRLQFTGATTKSTAQQWGFENSTYSWVNTDTNTRVQACDGANYSGYMWVEQENSKSSVLDASYKGKLSSWFTF